MLHTEHQRRDPEQYLHVGTLTQRLPLQAALASEHWHLSPSVPAMPSWYRGMMSQAEGGNGQVEGGWVMVGTFGPRWGHKAESKAES